MTAPSTMYADDRELSPELAALLRAGIADRYGFVCQPGQVEKNYKALHEGERAGYIRFVKLTHPKITDAGRAAVGAASEREERKAESRRICADILRTVALDPAKRNDPRTDFDYRSYKTMGYVCTLVFRQHDDRRVKPTVRVGRTLKSDPQFLGARNSIIQPESTEKFVLAVVPEWMTRPIKKPGGVFALPIFTTYPLPIDETDPAFTYGDREEWERLRAVCFSINSRIQRAPGKAAVKKFGPVWGKRRFA
jgi:hypothetical protein